MTTDIGVASEHRANDSPMILVVDDDVSILEASVELLKLNEETRCLRRNSFRSNTLSLARFL